MGIFWFFAVMTCFMIPGPLVGMFVYYGYPRLQRRVVFWSWVVIGLYALSLALLLITK